MIAPFKIARYAWEVDSDLVSCEIPMKGSTAHAAALVSIGRLGIDLIHVAEGEGFAPHVHEGDHVLINVGGTGTITVEGVIWPTQPGEVYIIEGGQPDAVGAVTDHHLLSIGAPHKLPDDPERMQLVPYKGVHAKFGDLLCRVCQPPVFLSDGTSCPHDPRKIQP